jgi:acyl-coenzyme A synthetase/AMP-(fatty) acid ligase
MFWGLVPDAAGRVLGAIVLADDDDGHLSAAAFAEQSKGTAAGLLRGRRRTGRHCVLAASDLEATVFMAASSRLGVVHNPTLSTLGPREVRFIIDQSCPSTLSSSCRMHS